MPAEPSGDRRPELQDPAPDSLVSDLHTTFGQQFLDVPIAQGKATKKAESLLDDRRRRAMAGLGNRLNPTSRESPTLGRPRFP
jgi:hypothetical protein